VPACSKMAKAAGKSGTQLIRVPRLSIREVKCFPERGLNRPSVREPRKRERLSDGDFARSGGII
ncbi:hypothetical protein, partial [Thermincola ferriacetica]|uniref:hypothetical protein n=1 Tax=Thermincola ferriacetica TaxID=281456 RepID=UPI001A9A3EDC